MTEQERLDIVSLQKDVAEIKRCTSCIPDLAQLVARHDERITSLDKLMTWGLGILGSAVIGIIVKILV